jgi:hypothetical protein
MTEHMNELIIAMNWFLLALLLIPSLALIAELEWKDWTELHHL